jgi:hypothetical protein
MFNGIKAFAQLWDYEQRVRRREDVHNQRVVLPQHRESKK